MPAILKKLMFYLAVLAVGLTQLFGVQAGFLCACTGSRAVQQSCEDSACHADATANEGCASQQNELVGAAECDSLPGSGKHNHIEARDPLLVVSFPTGAALPPVVLYDLPVAFDVPDFRILLLSAAMPERERVAVPEYGSPPMPLLVAETIVMLV